MILTHYFEGVSVTSQNHKLSNNKRIPCILKSVIVGVRKNQENLDKTSYSRRMERSRSS